MHLSSFFRNFNTLTFQQIRFYTRRRDPFPTKICHYLNRAKLIDSIRLSLRSKNPNSTLPNLINHRLFDSFVSLMHFVLHLVQIPHFPLLTPLRIQKVPIFHIPRIPSMPLPLFLQNPVDAMSSNRLSMISEINGLAMLRLVL
jgi:hypothetical protein